VEDVQDIIFSSKAAPATLLVQRGLKQVTIHIQPIYADIFDAGVKIPSIGIEFDQNAVDFTYQHVTPVEAVQVGFDNSLNTVRGIGETLAKIATHKLTSEESNGIGGPVRIAQTIGQESQFGLPIILTMVGTLSVNLGLMNLLPFPALDGGRILFLAYEWVARRPFDPRKEGLVHFAGMIMLLSFMAFITLRDIYMIAQAHGH